MKAWKHYSTRKKLKKAKYMTLYGGLVKEPVGFKRNEPGGDPDRLKYAIEEAKSSNPEEYLRTVECDEQKVEMALELERSKCERSNQFHVDFSGATNRGSVGADHSSRGRKNTESLSSLAQFSSAVRETIRSVG